MSLQPRMHRRHFLERSLLGFGSAFLLPSLLTGCTDHRIDPTDPNPPDGSLPPFLGDDTIDWNNDAKNVVTTGLGLVPEVGGILSGLVGAFWPTPEDTPWNQIKAQVSQFVNQKFDTYTYDQASGKLDALRQNMQDYLQKLNDGTPEEINNKWGTVVELFVNDYSNFTTTGYEVTLLPLFAQYSNLYLTLLRDPLLPTKGSNGFPNVDINGNMIPTGKDWGLTDKDLSDNLAALQTYITSAVNYTSQWYSTGRTNIVNHVQVDTLKVEPFKSTNTYDRQMTMLVLDYMDTWQYYDLSKYPIGSYYKPIGIPAYLFTREIYSDPYGNLQKVKGNTAINLPTPATQFPTQISVWAGDRLDAVQLTYPAGGGPNGVTTTPRMGDENGGSNQRPHGDVINMPPGWSITGSLLTYDLYDELIDGGPYTLENIASINTLQFVFREANGAQSFSPQYGPKTGYYKPGWIAYSGYALSSIYINGTAYNHPDTSTDCIVFGFLRQR